MTRARSSHALRLAVVCVLPLLGACAHVAPRARPGSAELRNFFYVDNGGLVVNTTGAQIEQPVSKSTTVRAGGLADYLTIATGESGGDGTGVHTHHRAATGSSIASGAPPVDAISSASVPTASDGDDSFQELRMEALGGSGSRAAGSSDRRRSTSRLEGAGSRTTSPTRRRSRAGPSSSSATWRSRVTWDTATTR